MTLGFSRDDSGKFLNAYLDKKILKQDPFQTIDQEGVGTLMRWAVQEGRYGYFWNVLKWEAGFPAFSF